MTSSIIYFNFGTRVLVRLAVSMESLRKHYGGPVALLHQGSLPGWMHGHCARLNVQTVETPNELHVEYPLHAKTRLWRYSPFDVSLFIDADTLILRDPSPLLDQLADSDKPAFGTTRFCDWRSNGTRIKARINGWREIVGGLIADAAIDYGPALNTAVIGWRRDHPLLPAWEQLADFGWESIKRGDDPCPMDRTLDEIACQIMVPRYKRVAIWDDRFNRSITHGIAPIEDTVIAHYHGGKHLIRDAQDPQTARLCDMWREAYRELAAIEPGVRDPQGDKHLTREAPQLLAALDNGPRDDLTICCAADPKYAPKLFRHMAQWMQMPGLREQRFLLFCINADASSPAYQAFDAFPNVRRVRYQDDAAPTPRERAFAAFVFGVAQHVDTPYHMKLDGDSTPKDGVAFEWPDYTAHTITSDPWRYTKVKGDPDAKQHWLRTLDEWWSEQPDGSDLPLFPDIDPSARKVGHDRIRSYCFIARTDFIRDLARRCGNRLPVPSHDTTAWYVATRQGLSINRYKFRRFITA